MKKSACKTLGVRHVGITHRIKQTAEGEARPTMVAIIADDNTYTIELKTEDDELDFLLGRYPMFYRPATETEKQILQPILDGEVVSKSNLIVIDHVEIRLHQLKYNARSGEIRVPCDFEGIKPSDRVGMCRGGSGDRLAAAISRRIELLEGSGQMMRITPALLKDEREKIEMEKADDHITLAKLAQQEPALFQITGPKERDAIRLNEAYTAREEAMKAHLAAEQRLRSSMIGRIFLSEEGGFPEGTIEEAFDLERSNDVVVTNLKKERDKRDNDLKKVMQVQPIWQHFFQKTPGCGERIAAGIVSAIGDISRFASDAKLKAFCGVHVLPGDIFPRKRRGQRCNWNPRARQSLFLFGDQINRRKDTKWNDMLQEYKRKLREKHPEPIKDEAGKTKYSNGHIHKMAIWKTLTKFVECLFREWKKLETNNIQALQTSRTAK